MIILLEGIFFYEKSVVANLSTSLDVYIRLRGQPQGP